jgi:hypothetical protein
MCKQINEENMRHLCVLDEWWSHACIIFSLAANRCNMCKSFASCTVRLLTHMPKNTSHTEECHKLHHQSGEYDWRRISKQNRINELRSQILALTYLKQPS